jgi:UDP-N-acetylenolpyruvoylglucosamine reductase
MLNFIESETSFMTIQENVPLAPLTTLQVGGAARYFAEEATLSSPIRVGRAWC